MGTSGIGTPEPRRPGLWRAGLRRGWRAGLDLILPLTCPGCGTWQPWCSTCRASLRGPLRRVDLGSWGGGSALRPLTVRALARYAAVPRAVVIAAKEGERRDLTAAVGRQLGATVAAVPSLVGGGGPGPLQVVAAPSRRAAARRRGGDPVAGLARAVAAEVTRRGHPAVAAECLITARGAVDSVGLDAAERAANLSGRVRLVARRAPPPGTTVLLVDDVVTTGATFREAAAVLDRAGLRIGGAVAVAAAAPWASPALAGPTLSGA